MTALEYPISRVTRKKISGRAVVVTLAPAGSQDEAFIGLRLFGTLTEYRVALSDLYRVAALWHGQREAIARRDARRLGIPWKRAKVAFQRANAIPKMKRPAKIAHGKTRAANLNNP